MNANDSSKRYRPLILIVVAVITACSWLPQIERLANQQIDAGLERALISFATARVLNAAISVVQGTEIAIQPVGVGVNLAPGQALDPVNDLVEQFSSLMLTASVAFGVQKVLLTIGSHWMISLAVTGFAAIWAALFLLNRCPNWVTRALIVLLFVRFAIPVATIATDAAFQGFMAEDYQSSQKSIDVTSSQIEKLAPPPPDAPESKGLLERFKSDWTSPLEAIRTAIERATEHIVKLMVIFILQTLIIPVLLLWVLYRLAVGAFRPPVPAGT